MLTGRRARMNAAMGVLLPDDNPDPGTDPNTPPAPRPAPPANPAPMPQFTQDQVNDFTAAARDKGKRQAISELSQQFGMSVEDAAALIKAHQDAEQAKLSEAEKAQQAATKAQQDAEADRQAAARERHEARVERLLARAGVSDQAPADGKLSPAARAIRLLDLEVGADPDAITKAIEQLRGDMPGLFGAPQAPAPTSDPGRGPAPRRDTSTPFGAKGLEEAKSRGWIKESA